MKIINITELFRYANLSGVTLERSSCQCFLGFELDRFASVERRAVWQPLASKSLFTFFKIQSQFCNEKWLRDSQKIIILLWVC